MALTLSTSRPADGSKDEDSSKPEHLEVLHMLGALNLVVPYLSHKVIANILCSTILTFEVSRSVL